MVLSNNIEQTKITLGICNVCAIKQFGTQKKKKKKMSSLEAMHFFFLKTNSGYFRVPRSVMLVENRFPNIFNEAHYSLVSFAAAQECA